MNIQKDIADLNRALESVKKEEKVLQQIMDAVVTTLKKGGKIITCGNGGSAADAEHLAAELIGRFLKERKSLPAISLCNGASLTTCLGNDYGFENLFARQIDGLGNPEDLLICFSTSGNSPNVMEAIRTAKKKSIKTVAFLGKDGGKTKGMADYQIIVSDVTTPRIQEAHTFLMHLIAQAIDDAYC